MTRDNILLRERAVSKMVALRNDRTFYAKYERTRCAYLPPNIRVAKKRTTGPCRRRRQAGVGMIGNLLKMGVNIGSKHFRSPIAKKLSKKA